MKLKQIYIDLTVAFFAIMIGFIGGYGYKKNKDNQEIKSEYKSYRDSVESANELRIINFTDKLLK